MVLVQTFMNLLIGRQLVLKFKYEIIICSGMKTGLAMSIYIV